MGRLADEVAARLKDRLAERLPGFDWEVERRVGGTPVDVVGVAEDRLLAVELEWRRADPADNAAKLFRHLADGTAATGRVDVFQLFTAYYDLASGGVSSKRENAEFVGSAAADVVDGLAYHAVDLDIAPPRGDDAFDVAWEDALAEAVEHVVAAC